MKYVRQYIQETVKADTPEEFDARMNSVFAKASKSGKDPNVYYHPELYSATVRYWVTAEIAETIAEEYELQGQGKKCFECPLYSLPKDKRIKYTHCEHGGRISACDDACNWYYEVYGRQVIKKDNIISLA